MLPLAVPAVPWNRRSLVACAAIGFVMAALASSVFVPQDQSAPGSSTRISTGPYYERVLRGRAGRGSLPDRLHPVQYALTSGHWWSADRPSGNGPDFFALHLARASESLPGGQAIPPWMPWAVSLPWAAVLL